MHSGTADRLRIGNEVRELKLGRSFSSSSGSAFHSIRYDFKPASVDTSKSANVEVGEKNQITVTVPHIENSLSQNSGTAHTVFKGSQRPYNRECVLVVDNVTGEVTLERLSCNIQLKKTRAEGSSKIQPRPITPIDSGSSGGGAGSRKHSPSAKLSPPQPQTNGKHGSSWASSSPNGPLQQQQQQPARSQQQHQPRISPSQPQRGSPPGSQSSPSMPTLVTPREGGGGGSSSRAPSASRDSMPLLTTETLHDCQEVPDVGVLSDSSDSSNSTSKSSASSDSSDSEHEDAPPHKNASSSHSSKAHHTAVNGTNGQHSSNASLSMPRFSQLSEDLHLSESGSDSDD